MKKTTLSISLLLLLSACSPSMKTTSSWTNQDKSVYQNKTFKTVFISVLTSNLELRTKLENEMSIAAKKHGFSVIKSMDKFPPGKTPSKEEALTMIRNAGADLIFTTALVDEKSEKRYVPGTSFSPSFYGGYRGYYLGTSAYYQPGYYTTDKTYFLETNIFDAFSENLIWTAQSEVYNPNNIEKACKHYTDLMLESLENDGVIKATKK